MIVALYYASLVFVFLVVWPIKRKAKEKQWLNKFYDKAVSVLLFDWIVLVTMFCYLEMLILGILVYQKNAQQWGFGDPLAHPEQQYHALQAKQDREDDPDYYQAHNLQPWSHAWLTTPVSSESRSAAYEDSTGRLLAARLLGPGSAFLGSTEEVVNDTEEIDPYQYTPDGGSLFVAVYYLCGTMLLLPLLVIFVVSRPLEKHRDKNFLRRWGGTLYEIKTESRAYNKAHSAYICLYVLRRALFVLFIFTLSACACGQIIFTLLMSMLMAIYLLQFKPFDSKATLWIRVYDECAVFLATECLIFFTDYLLFWE